MAAALLMGVALLATVGSTYRSVVDVSQLLIRGQADMLHDALRSRVGWSGRAVDQATLDDLLDEYESDGLRYAAILNARGQVSMAAGTLDGPIADVVRIPLLIGVGEPLERGDRVWVWYGRPARDLPENRGRRRRWLPAPVVLSFEPVIADRLRAAAGRSLAIGGLAGAGFLFVALGMIRWALRREALERQLEHGRRLASLGEMSAVLAHEIRNPLASLKGNAQLLARGFSEGERERAKADRVVDEAVRLERLVNDLLEFARSGELKPEEVNPAEVIRSVAAEVDAQRIRIEDRDAPTAWSLDRGRIAQVIHNLLDNAVQAGDGPIDVAVRQEGGHLVFEVSDRGPGIPPDDLPRIFEPFYSRRTRGTGLGLAVARRLVELHGGTITADQSLGGGARFRVRIPPAKA